MKISEIITDKYKLRMPPTVYYELLADVVEMEEEQEPCEDAISRQAVIEGINRYIKKAQSTGTKDDFISFEELVVKELPSVNPQDPKTGHWIRWYEQKENDCVVDNIPHCKCSECGKEYDPHSSQFIKYCNECGAKMVEPQESESKRCMELAKPYLQGLRAGLAESEG